MKKLVASIVLCFGLCASAFAANYFEGQCGVGGPFNPYPAGTIGGTAGPSNCAVGDPQPAAAQFSDTSTFYLGNWNEFYGIWAYTSSTEVVASGGTGLTPCSGRGCHGQPYQVIITSATIDGVPLNPPASGYTWSLPIDLAPGAHVLAVTGTVTGGLGWARWGAAVKGILYTLEPLPTPPPCNDCGGD